MFWNGHQPVMRWWRSIRSHKLQQPEGAGTRLTTKGEVMYTRLCIAAVMILTVPGFPAAAEEKKEAAAQTTEEAALPAVRSIPAEKVDDQKIFWGKPAQFTKAGEVDYKAVMKATPEYEAIKENKIESGTAKYWILISKASNRAVQVIAAVGEESKYDLIASDGYLSNLEPPVPADDLTDLVLARLDEKK
jgi:hypothetical protein